MLHTSDSSRAILTVLTWALVSTMGLQHLRAEEAAAAESARLQAECVLVGTEAPPSARVGERFSVAIVVGAGDEGPVEDLFGISGRLRFSRSDILSAVEVFCTNLDGTPMDLGDDVICFGRIEPGQSFVDFAVTRKAESDGASGVLRVARIELAFDESAPDGECSHFTVSDLHGVDSDGERICLEIAPTSSRTCVSGACTVWPGDTNNDGSVDEADIVTLGVFWAIQGPAREGAGCRWQGVETECWAEQGATFSDAYGDGRVGVEDVLCIGLNWDEEHPATGARVALPRRDPAALRRAYEEMYAYLESAPESGDGVHAAKRALESLLQESRAPAAHALDQNVPNPFNPSTLIRIRVAARSSVQLAVFDVFGRRIKGLVDREMEAGIHPVEWNGTDSDGNAVPSGLYVYRATIGGETLTRKMVLAR
jgi:hypothetical protein